MTIIFCRSKCCSLVCEDIENTALWINTLRALRMYCPKETTLLDGTPKKEVKE